jgi:histidyl-tRNA synthetase
MEMIGVAGDQPRKLKVLRAIDKLDRLGLDGVRQLLGAGRKDESGDFTPGAGLNPEQAQAVLFFAEGTGDGNSTDFFERLDGLFAKNKAETGKQGLEELVRLFDLIKATPNGPRILPDPSVVRGLEYYTGPVFEAELFAPIKDEKGQTIRLGSVVSGGRYDGLVERFTGEKVPATGISIGVSRLLFGLQRLGKYKESATQGPVVVLVLDRGRVADYQKMVQSLREAGIRAELYLGEGGLKAQMKYADKRGSPCVVIQGGDEKSKGEVQIKDLVLGATLTSIENRDDYLKEQAEAQFAVPEVDLVKAVRQVLSRHKD